MAASASTATPLDVADRFPVLARPGLVYLDSGATSQKPASVIAAIADHYAHHNANIHRGVYPLAVEATDAYEGGRQKIADWLGSTAKETVFAKNATEAINLVAYSWGRDHVGAGDQIVLTHLEHHANVVPWQVLAQAVGAELVYLPLDGDGMVDLDVLDATLAGGRVKLVACAHVSNVMGTITPIAEIVRRTHAAGAVALVDGSQAVPQMPVWLPDIDADFYVWTAHKVYGPTGLGVLHGRRALLEAMPPFLTGGDMIASVDFDVSRYNELPWKFEAGTSPIAEVAGMSAAVDFLQELGMENVRAHERDLTAYALARLAEVPGLTVYGPPDAERRGGIVSWTMDCAHPHDVAEILARDGVCVRAGHHCAQPLMRVLGVSATTRASFAVHNSRADVDALISGLHNVRKVFA